MVLKKRFFWALLIVPLVLLAGCPVPEARPEGPAPEEPAPVVNQEPTPAITTVSSEVVGGLRLELSVPKVNFQPGETVIATLSLINTTQDAISFETRTSQLFDLIIKGPGRDRLWSEDKMFLTVITHRHIPPNQALSKDLPWEVGIAPGELSLVGVTVIFELNGEGIQLRTPSIRIEIGSS
ncbi:MAG: hypothetical protein DDT30_01147 [Dehalococcoidia bacterium]|nr:hypothetical protein [Bacillota bacterium]MBT9142544.1 hypothetical protein [Bacillota bacterium]MBT9166288.1 hypothetical protein [Chloroflexota bacterium]